MKSLTFAWVLLCTGWLFTLSTPQVSADEPNNQPYVILVGIDDYKDKQIVDRVHAEEDAKSLYKLFADKEFLGVDEAHIKLLLGDSSNHPKSQQATRTNILNALKWAIKNAKRDDLVIYVFIGQGAPIGERACYFAVDSTFTDRKKDAVASGDIEQILNKLNSQRFAVFLDVNFKGFDSGRETPPDPNLGGFYREFLGQEDPEKDFSRVVFLANSGLKPSLNLGKHGLFTDVLLKGLGGQADRFGYEADGLITVGELAKYIRTELPALARKMGKTADEKGQTPIVLEGQSHDFVLDHNPKAFPEAQKTLDQFLQTADKDDLAKNLIEEGQDLLFRMPKLEGKQKLRKVYQSYAKGTINSDKFKTERETVLAGMRLSDRDATKYAELILRATTIVQSEFFKKVDRGLLIEDAIRGIFKEAHENIPSSIEEKLKNAKDLRDVQLLRLLLEARKHLGLREDLTKGKDVTHSLHAMLGKLDQHTDYIDPETLRQFLISFRGGFSGIGVQIRKNNTKDMLQVVTPIMGSPAYKAGMYAGDMITTIIREVNEKGEPLTKPEVISTKGMSTSDAVKKIIGKSGTKVKLIVEREGSEKPIEFELIRGQVEVETVMGHKRKKDDGWDFVIDPENKICYVRLSEFSRNTKRDLAKVMKQLSSVGIKGFILDLRFNPGGLLDSAVNISDLFIEDGMIVTIKPRSGTQTSYVGKSDGSYLSFPMVCLVNGYSASGSEIVSACLQDHGRAIIIGTRSYGKGSVQTILPFTKDSRLKLTTATFWRPNGQNLNKSSTSGKKTDIWGVKPNKGFNIEISRKELNELQDFMRNNEIIQRPDRPRETFEFNDRQLNSALDYLRGQIKTASTGPNKDRPVNN